MVCNIILISQEKESFEQKRQFDGEGASWEILDQIGD
jgi:hypothetical protein